MYTGERDLKEGFLFATPAEHIFKFHLETQKSSTLSVMRKAIYFRRCARWRESAELPRKMGGKWAVVVVVLY